MNEDAENILLVSGILGILILTGVSSWFFFTGIQGTALSTQDGNVGYVSEMGVEKSTGFVTGRINTNDWRDDDAYWKFGRENSYEKYWIKLGEVEADTLGEPDEEWEPTTLFLYRNGYADNREPLDDVSKNNLVNNYQDSFDALASGTVCKANLEIRDGGRETTVNFEDGTSTTFESDDSDSPDLERNTGVIKSDDVRIDSNGNVFCGFNRSKIVGTIFDKNVSSISEGRLSFNGDDSEDGTIEFFSVRFRFDEDADGVIDDRDNCPDEKGEKRFSGCPDTPPVVKSSSIPDIVNVGQRFTTSINAVDPESRGVSIEWSNGGTGITGEYIFYEAGAKNISVTVTDDKFARVSGGEQSITKYYTVSVEDKDVFYTPLKTGKCDRITEIGGIPEKNVFDSLKSCEKSIDANNTSLQEIFNQNRNVIGIIVILFSLLLIGGSIGYYARFGRGRNVDYGRKLPSKSTIGKGLGIVSAFGLLFSTVVLGGLYYDYQSNLRNSQDTITYRLEADFDIHKRNVFAESDITGVNEDRIRKLKVDTGKRTFSDGDIEPDADSRIKVRFNYSEKEGELVQSDSIRVVAKPNRDGSVLFKDNVIKTDFESLRNMNGQMSNTVKSCLGESLPCSFKPVYTMNIKKFERIGDSFKDRSFGEYLQDRLF